MQMTASGLDHVLAKAYQPEYGARPLRRYLEKHVTTEISRLLIAGDLDHDAVLLIEATPPHDGDWANTNLIFRVQQGSTPTKMEIDTNGNSAPPAFRPSPRRRS